MNHSERLIAKIVSGGQTGVDRAAFDVAIFLEIEHGGWCPRGRRAEDGRIPAIYQLKETPSFNYAVRTERNVIDSDGTLILYRQRLEGGTDLTRRKADQHQRPLLCFDLECDVADDREIPAKADQFRQWVQENNIQVLNIAGPRESTNPGITAQAEQFLIGLLGSPASS